jgi:hypothetical protein
MINEGDFQAAAPLLDAAEIVSSNSAARGEQ